MPVVDSVRELAHLLGKEKERGRKVVTTNGCFDLLHIGHVRYLEEARALGDLLVVGINSDASVRKLKGKGRPVVAQQHRAEIVAALRMVDYVFVFDDADPIAFLNVLKPDIHAKGGDYAIAQIVERGAVEGNGGKVALLKMVEGQSTTGILRKITR